MKKAAVAFLLILIAERAVAATGDSDVEGSVHVGLKIGPSNMVNYPTGYGYFGGYTVIGTGAFSGNGFLSGTSIALEAEYVDIGSALAGTEYKRASTFGMVAAATYWIDGRFAVIAKAGPSVVVYKSACTAVACSDGSGRTLGLHGAVAGQYRLSPLMSLRFGYDFYPNSYSMTSFSALYRY